ncbi:hypothetical protein JX265_008821 [Neoarthrinium moseri]|uniref:Major facilitator superfamily (MFS) profile domain-containing protein n=1 Tax=Neoarthrinium moseri TaxID=1658444 RepID=A0A9P9WHI7_9PEZI|nr:uncharacterized protein JN550_009538 [Neoarthrinium moseri]KAI1848397.1 hypothetical protein JX266_005703 [Neoarthrinium moseri]KAI1863427.1 hypothetical protein JN550_009538 [Neoarthrinium moseri]KAI1863604.1 hypothetical protein JX265_008821 [Neoarthrinium moseri]
MASWKHAFSLSKAEVKEAKPPGTVVLIEHHGKTDTEASGDTDTRVRHPIPSADPADPLNWAPWRKHAVLAVAALYAFISNFTAACIAPALELFPVVYPNEHRTFAEVSRLIAVHVLFQGAGNILWVPLSNILGRRPVLLAATLMLTLCTLWCAVAPTYDSLLAARLFQGLGNAAAETVSPALIGDVYFMDERGRAMAVYTIFLVAGSLVGGLAGGKIAFTLGWTYIFWISLALSALTFLGTLFFNPETLYQREYIFPRDHEVDQKGTKDGRAHVEGTVLAPTETSPTTYPPYTFVRSLGFIKPPGGWVHQFLQPWRTLKLPGTWVVMFHYAGLVGGIVTISTIGPQIVAMPPYLWGANAGLINIGALVGNLLGAIYTYVLSDSRLAKQAKHESHGFAEPESRLPTMLPALFIATAGFFIFGFCAQNPGPAVWVGLQFGYGMVAFGLMQVPSIGFNYLIDSYSYLAADCFVMVTILRAIIAFAWTFFVAEWVAARGAAEPFGIFGMLMAIFSLLTIPLWLYGKRMRIATAGLLEH